MHLSGYEWLKSRYVTNDANLDVFLSCRAGNILIACWVQFFDCAFPKLSPSLNDTRILLVDPDGDDDGFMVAHVDHIPLQSPIARYAPEHAVPSGLVDHDDVSILGGLAHALSEDAGPPPPGYTPPSLQIAKEFFKSYLPHRIPDTPQASG